MGDPELGFIWAHSESGQIECHIYEKRELVAKVPVIPTTYPLRFDGNWLRFFHPIACQWYITTGFWNITSMHRAVLPNMKLTTLLAQIFTNFGYPSLAIVCKQCKAVAIIRKDTLCSEFSTCQPCLKQDSFGLGDEWCGMIYHMVDGVIYYTFAFHGEQQWSGPVHSSWAQFDLENGRLYVTNGGVRVLVEKFWDLDGTRDTGFTDPKEALLLSKIGNQEAFRCAFCNNYFHTAPSEKRRNMSCKRCISAPNLPATNFQTACVVCKKNSIEVLLLPCKHAATCIKCFVINNVEKCPKCNDWVQHVNKIALV